MDRRLWRALAALALWGWIMAVSGQAQARTVRLVALGDSLTEGWGLSPAEAFPAVLERELRAKGRDVTIVNQGVSGDTTAGGLARVQAVLAAGPDGVILELGANDGLRGIEPARVEANLEAVVTRLRQAGIPVLLAGMKTLSGMGRAYGEEFARVYPRLAARHGLVFYPFFLEGVAGETGLNQPDGLHPTAQGVREIVRRFLPTAEAFLATLDVK